MLFTTDRALEIMYEKVSCLEQLIFTYMFFTFLLIKTQQWQMLFISIKVFCIKLVKLVIMWTFSLWLLSTGTFYLSILLKLKIMKLACFAEDFEMTCPDHLETEPGLVSVNPKLLLYPLDHADDTTKHRIWGIPKCKCRTKFQFLL